MSFDLYSMAGHCKISEFNYEMLLQLAKDSGWKPLGTAFPSDPLWDGNYRSNNGQMMTTPDTLAFVAALKPALEKLPKEPAPTLIEHIRWHVEGGKAFWKYNLKRGRWERDPDLPQAKKPSRIVNRGNPLTINLNNDPDELERMRWNAPTPGKRAGAALRLTLKRAIEQSGGEIVSMPPYPIPYHSVYGRGACYISLDAAENATPAEWFSGPGALVYLRGRTKRLKKALRKMREAAVAVEISRGGIMSNEIEEEAGPTLEDLQDWARQDREEGLELLRDLERKVRFLKTDLRAQGVKFSENEVEQKYVVMEYQETYNSNPPYWKSGEIVYRRVVAVFGDWGEADQEAARLMQARTEDQYTLCYKSGPVWPGTTETLETAAHSEIARKVDYEREIENKFRRYAKEQIVNFRVAAATLARQEDALLWLEKRLGGDLTIEEVWNKPSQYDSLYWARGLLSVPEVPPAPEPELILKRFDVPKAKLPPRARKRK